MMRWKYLLPRLVVMGLVWAFFVYAFDPLLRRALVATGERAAGAKVDVAGVETTFFPPSLALRGVEVANRSEAGTNLVEFDSFRLQLAGEPLLHGAVVVRDGAVSGLRWGTERADSGQIDETGPSLAGRMVHALRRQMVALGKQRLADFVQDLKLDWDPKRLETVHVADALAQQWQARFDGYESRVKAFQTRIEALQEGVRSAKGNTLQKVEAYRRAALEVNQLLAEAQRIRVEMQGLTPQAKQDLRQIEAARDRDRAAIRQKLDRLKPDGDGLSRTLLGPELVDRLDQAVAWLRWSREKIDVLTADVEPPRARGTDVEFPRRNPTPGFVLERLALSGEAEIGDEVVPFEGTLTDASSNPVLHGKPTVLQVAARVKDSNVQVATTLDQTGAVPVHNVALTWTLPRETRLQLGNPQEFALDVAAARTTCAADLTLVGEQLQGHLVLRQEGVTLAAHTAGDDEGAEVLGRVVRAAAADVHAIDMVVELAGTVDEPRWTLKSNLGPQLADGIHGFVAAEIERRHDELSQRVETTAQEKLGEFKALLGERFRVADALLTQHEAKARELVGKVAGNPLDVQGLLRR